jgi:hypothetical protein
VSTCLPVNKYAVQSALKHGNVGSRHRHLGSVSFSVEPDFVAFINGVGVEYGESYATCFVRERMSVGLQNEEEGCVDLPSYFSKKKLYEGMFFYYFLNLSYLSNISLLDFVLSTVIF